MADTPELKKKYKEEIIPAMKKEFGYENDLAVPTLEKVVVNAGMGEALKNAEALEKMSGDLALITGQKPLVTKSKHSISNFKVQVGSEVGLKVTLRGKRMWDFVYKLISVVLPRVRDFRGVSRRAFDGFGNYSLGIREHTVFSEVDPNKVDKLRSLQVIICTTAQSDEEGRKLLELMGMPFAKEAEARALEKMKEEQAEERKARKEKRRERAAVDMTQVEEETQRETEENGKSRKGKSGE